MKTDIENIQETARELFKLTAYEPTQDSPWEYVAPFYDKDGRSLEEVVKADILAGCKISGIKSDDVL